MKKIISKRRACCQGARTSTGMNETSGNGTNPLCRTLLPNTIGRLSQTIIGYTGILFVLFNVMSNVLLIFALHKSKQLRTFSNKIILLMSISDLSFGIFVLPVLAMFWITGKQRNCLELKTVEILTVFFGYVTCFTIICISVDRYLHVTKPARYQTLMNSRRRTVSVVLCLVTGFLTAVICAVVASFYQQLIMGIVNIILITIFLILNIKSHKTLERHQKNMVVRFQPAKQLNINDTNHTREKLAAVKTIRSILSMFLICYCPYNIASVMWTYHRFETESAPGVVLDTFYEWSCILMFSGTFLNSLIIIRGNSKCRKFVLSLLCKISVDN
ncbi:histamine H2 receptor-like [Rhopilema esculentum]|uniref:histamine H2 receptor-like n=1 Tax=Rhopilema esculentum TaxID=499914 RepID=UPI0031E44A3E